MSPSIFLYPLLLILGLIFHVFFLRGIAMKSTLSPMECSAHVGVSMYMNMLFLPLVWLYAVGVGTVEYCHSTPPFCRAWCPVISKGGVPQPEYCEAPF